MKWDKLKEGIYTTRVGTRDTFYLYLSQGKLGIRYNTGAWIYTTEIEDNPFEFASIAVAGLYLSNSALFYEMKRALT